MIPRSLVLLVCVLPLTACGQEAKEGTEDVRLRATAERLAHQFIIVDTHIDVPYRLHEKMEDITTETPDGNFDYPRAKMGGLNAAFMSIYIPASYEGNGAKALADTLIDMVQAIVVRSPENFANARSVAEVRSQFEKGVISLPMGMENGAPIEGNLQNVRYFYDRGIRYITLAHSKNNHLGDSSYDTSEKWHGLSPFGEKVVLEMNRLGIMVDVSHLSDSTFYDVMKISQAPVIASHSSCRYFTPDFERNMSDDMIKLLASKGGVIQINFGSSFLGTKYRGEHAIKHAQITDVVAHIDHVVQLVGIDFVGLGSDFDGVGDSLPHGLEDVSKYPDLLYALLQSGYSEEDIRKVCGENLLRVWSQVEQRARALQEEK